jgi:hypothetical protein
MGSCVFEKGNYFMQKLKRGLLFIFVGLPGFLLFFCNVIGIIIQFVVQPTIPSLRDFVGVAIALLLGAFLLQIYEGKLRQWMYIFVLMPFPILLPLCFKISEKIEYKDKGAIWIIASGIAAFVVNGVVKRYYVNRSQNDSTKHSPAQGAMN